MLIIFDFDGTLADTWDLFADELVAGAAPLGLKQLDRAEVEKLRQLETKEVFKTLGVPWWRLPRVVSLLRRRARELASRIALFPGMPDVVRTLHADGHVLAVVSSNAEATVRDVLGELSTCFAHFACSSSVFGKAAKFRKLRRRSGVPAARIVAVGDETRDLDAAAAAGITGIAVTWGYNDPALLQAMAPERTVTSPAALLEALQSFARDDRPAR